MGFKNKYGRRRSFRDYKVPETCTDRGDIRDKYLFAEAAARGAFMRFWGGGAQKTSRPLFQLIFTCWVHCRMSINESDLLLLLG